MSLLSLHALQTLDVSSNQLQSIPCALHKLKNLCNFYASDNLIEVISDDLLQCSKLTTLDLRNNRIKAVPSTLSLHLTKLTVLLLDGNAALNL